MKNLKYIISIVVILALIGTFVFSSNKQDNTINTSNNENTQKVILSYKNGNYYPNTITVKVNQPVSISLDNSVRGCYRVFTIRELKVSKYLATPEDSVTFTPTETGTYRFACSMGMGTGTLIVE